MGNPYYGSRLNFLYTEFAVDGSIRVSLNQSSILNCDREVLRQMVVVALVIDCITSPHGDRSMGIQPYIFHKQHQRARVAQRELLTLFGLVMTFETKCPHD